MNETIFWIGGCGLLTGVVLSAAVWLYRSWRERIRLRTLTDYLEQVNLGKAGLTFPSGEDELSRLQDEIYKTVTMLHQTRDAALESKRHYAENLANIAHQIKTPITSISLSAQMLTGSSGGYPEQIKKQVLRLTHLEEALLLLSRIDAGTLELKKQEADVFTVLTLAADNLQELLMQANVAIDIPEQGEIRFLVDPEWTMEAVMNLMKNCMEHTPPGGTVHCIYEENPMYTLICIRDEGPGFAEEDLPHLFERFYRGHDAKDGGIGIGLSLAKEIIEMQNGTIRAENIPDGGACFEIRLYSH